MPGILILGAGFGGLELSTLLSEALGDDAGVTLIDSGDAFVFGYSKLDVMFGRTTLDAGPASLRGPGQAGRAVAAGDGHRDRSRGAARDDRPRRPRGGRARRRARRRLRLRRDARAARARQRVLLGRRGRAAARGAARRSRAGARSSASAGRRSSARPRRARRRCCCTTTCRSAAFARTARSRSRCRSGRPSRPRPTRRPRCSRRSPSAGSSSSPAAGSARSSRGVARARRRQRAALRPLPRRPEAPRARRRARERDGRRRLRAGRPGAPSRPGSRASTRSATSPRSACRRRASSPSAQARVVAASLLARLARRRAAGALRRARLLLHRVRGRPRRPGRRRLLLGPEADRDLPGAVRGPRRREAALRREPPRALVRPRLAGRHGHPRRPDLRLLGARRRRAAPAEDDVPGRERRDAEGVAGPHRRVAELRRHLHRRRQPAVGRRERANELGVTARVAPEKMLT